MDNSELPSPHTPSQLAGQHIGPSIGDTRIIKISKPNQPDEFAIQVYRSRLPDMRDQVPGEPQWITIAADIKMHDIDIARIALAFWRKHGSWTAIEVIGE